MVSIPVPPQAWNDVVHEAPYALVVTAVLVAGLLGANALYDRGVPQYVSRKVGHIVAGIAFILAVTLLSSALWPLMLSALFSLLLFGARIVRPDTFRGVGGSGRDKKACSEVWFALVIVPVVGVAWLYLDRPQVALASLLFMAWGDGVTGLVRARIYHRPVKGLWGSLTMFIVCVMIGLALIRPAWIGAVVAAVAVVAERVFGEAGVIKWADDNWAVALLSMGTILGLMLLGGIL